MGGSTMTEIPLKPLHQAIGVLTRARKEGEIWVENDGRTLTLATAVRDSWGFYGSVAIRMAPLTDEELYLEIPLYPMKEMFKELAKDFDTAEVQESEGWITIACPPFKAQIPWPQNGILKTVAPSLQALVDGGKLTQELTLSEVEKYLKGRHGVTGQPCEKILRAARNLAQKLKVERIRVREMVGEGQNWRGERIQQTYTVYEVVGDSCKAVLAQASI